MRLACLGVVGVLLACGGAPALPVPPPLVGRVPAAPTLESIAAGETFGCVHTHDEVRCWGYHVPGMPLEPAHRDTAQRIADLDGAIAIAGGRDQLCAIMGDHTVRCAVMRSVPTGKYDVHGYEYRAQRPEIVRPAVRDVAQVAAGTAFTCALIADGTVQCWGINNAGQLGDGTRKNRDQPAPVAALQGVVEIAAGLNGACARLQDGSVRCWGNRGEHDSLDVRAIAGISAATQLACGAGYACARIADGTVRCWGGNLSGQLGDGTRETRAAAVSVVNLRDAVAVAAGENHTCALLGDGGLACWGDNTYGELGARTPADVARDEQESTTTFHWIERHSPDRVAAITDAHDLALGTYFTCVRTSTGDAMCFGRNELGQAGAAPIDTRPEPMPIGNSR
jgi:alpha-tubulin suppressor-like RCC1 family protein